MVVTKVKEILQIQYCLWETYHIPIDKSQSLSLEDQDSYRDNTCLNNYGTVLIFLECIVLSQSLYVLIFIVNFIKFK